MNYRKLVWTGQTVSALGFGAMRLPTLDGRTEVDLPASVELIRQAVDLGVNYLDTAYVYHAGAAEAIVGKALEDGYRDKVRIATKRPVWRVKSRSDCNRMTVWASIQAGCESNALRSQSEPLLPRRAAGRGLTNSGTIGLQDHPMSG